MSMSQQSEPRADSPYLPARMINEHVYCPSAGSGGLLCEGLGERAAVVIAQPVLKLGGGELAIRLDDGPLAVHPLGLDRVEPRALARQAADEETAPGAGGL